MPLPREQEELTRLHEQAWVGDAVLALWAREWILREDARRDGEKMVRMTNNRFLAAFGNPTAEEAEIGKIYQSHGLQAAFDYCSSRFLNRFRQEENNRRYALAQRKPNKRGH